MNFMKTLEMNEQSQKTEVIYFLNYPYLTYQLSKSTKLYIKVISNQDIVLLPHRQI